MTTWRNMLKRSVKGVPPKASWLKLYKGLTPCHGLANFVTFSGSKFKYFSSPTLFKTFPSYYKILLYPYVLFLQVAIFDTNLSETCDLVIS